MVQYFFIGPVVEIKFKPHGNTRSNKPFFRTAESTKRHLRELTSKHTPSEVVNLATAEEGGEIYARGASCLPRDRMQIKNFKRCQNSTTEENVLYSVMLECKLAQGKSEAFVRDVKAAPEPMAVVFYDWQLNDLERCCTNNHSFSVLGVDTTFSLGDFYVTPTTYRHLMLEDAQSGKHPAIIGPVLVHQQLKFSSFNYFFSTFVNANKQLRHVLAVGSDGDEALVQALSHNFSFAQQLRCFYHFEKNVREKLRSLAIPSKVIDEFVYDIFGHRHGQTMEEGLVDCVSIADFNSKLDTLETVWNAREDPYCGKGGPQFYRYFKQHKAPVIRHNMLRCYREAVGLGSPPAAYTTNACESVNAIIKQHVQYKASRWPEFNEKLRKLVNSKHEEIIRSLSGRELYHLTVQYSQLAVEPELWFKMRPDQRMKAVKQFEGCSVYTSKASSRRKLSFCTETSDSSSSVVPEGQSQQEHQQVKALSQHQQQKEQPGRQQQQHKVLSVSAEESGIDFLPLVTLQMIWQKAEKLLNSKNAITNAPGSDNKARMVLSQSSAVPHFVTTRDDGQYLCDNSCPQWVSSKLCSHTVAAAEDSGQLCEFLQWYINTQPCPNVTALGMQGMPSNRRKKLSDRKRKADSDPDVFVPRTALASTTQPQTTTGMSSYHWEADRVANISTSLYMCPAVPPYLGQPHPPVYPTCSTAMDTHMFGCSAGASSTSMLTTGPSNPNPFYLKFITGNIRICQGCRQSLRTSSGLIPDPPYNLVVARSLQNFSIENCDIHCTRPTIDCLFIDN